MLSQDSFHWVLSLGDFPLEKTVSFRLFLLAFGQFPIPQYLYKLTIRTAWIFNLHPRFSYIESMVKNILTLFMYTGTKITSSIDFVPGE